MSVVVVNVSSGSTTTTLPLISSVPGAMITIKDSGSASASNTITIVPTAGNTFEAGTYIINSPLGFITFLGIGTRWRVIATRYPHTPVYTSIVVNSNTGTPGVASGTLNTLTVTGQTTLVNISTTTLTVTGATNLASATLSTLSTLGQAAFYSSVQIQGGLSVFSSIATSNINFTGGIYSNGVLFTGGSGSPILSTLSTIGRAAFYSSVQIQGGVSVFSSLTATNINFTGLLTSNGTTFSGTPPGLNSAGSIGINSASNASYSLLVTGNQSNTGTLQVAGTTTLVNSSNTGTLGVAGTTTLSNTSNTGTLGVAGTTTLSNTSNTGTLGVAGATTLTNTSNTGTLGVAGTTTLTNTSNTGTLGVAGTTTLTNTSNTGTLGVAGTTTLTNTSNTGTLGVAGTTTLTNTSNTGTLGVAGYTTLASNLTIGSGLGSTGQANTLVRLNQYVANGNWGYLCSTDGLGDVSLGANCYTSNGSWYRVNYAGGFSFVSARQGSIKFWCGAPGAISEPGNTDTSLTAIMSLTASGMTVTNTSNTGTLGVAGAVTFGGTLNVTGLTTLVNSSNTGTLGVAGATTLAGTLNVTGLTTLVNSSNTGTLGVAGNATFGGSITGSSLKDPGGSDRLTFGNSSQTTIVSYAGSGNSIEFKQVGTSIASIDRAGAINAKRYETTGGNMAARTGGVYSYTNGYQLASLESASYQSINWIPGLSGANTYDNTSQGACGMICSAAAGGARIDFFLTNTPATTAPNRVAAISANGNNSSTRIFLTSTDAGSSITSGNPDVLSLCHNANIQGTSNSFTPINPAGFGSAIQAAQGWVRTIILNNNGSGGFNTGMYTYLNNNGLGIGTINPICPLHVASSASFSQTATGYFYGSSQNTGVVPGAVTDQLSIKADQIIWTNRHFLAQSDERIKKNISSVSDSLDIVNSLNVVKYDYIDITQNSVKHGLIAQKVKEVYPEAVHSTTDYIPSVVRLATYEKTENVTITTPIAHGFAVNDKIKMYVNQDDNPDTRDFEYKTEVLEVLSESEFVVKPWDNFELGQDLFIYGKEVNDFLGVDKPLIGLIAAGACKILSGQVTTQSSTISTLQTNAEAQASTITGLQATVDSQASTITSILEKYPV